MTETLERVSQGSVKVLWIPQCAGDLRVKAPFFQILEDDEGTQLFRGQFLSRKLDLNISVTEH